MGDAILIPVVTWGLALWLALYVLEIAVKIWRKFR